MPFAAKATLYGLAASLALAGGACSALVPAPGASTAPAPDVFSVADSKAVTDYWTSPGRYVVEASPDSPNRVNITIEGSKWYGRFSRLAASRSKDDPDVAAWRVWLKAKLAADKAKASLPKADSVVAVAAALTPAPLTPAAVKRAIGDPPPLYELVYPQRYTVTFAPDDSPAPFVYTDNINFGNRASYFTSYRQSVGVIKMGQRVRDAEGAEKSRVDALFASVGRTDAERHVLQAVSTLEGGFASINTYDTGYVSVGLIQFIFARDGDGSLAAVLARMKTDDPAAFAADFHRFGVDVDANGIVDVVPPAAGKEVHGADAVQAIIADKRLTAVFERAGDHDAFRRAQLLIARQHYWPADDVVTISRAFIDEQAVGAATPTQLAVFYGTPDAPPDPKTALAAAQDKHKGEINYRAWIVTDTISAPVSAFVKSEAGIATLMDRKVNRGNIGAVPEVAADLMQRNNLTQFSDLAAYERPLLQAMKYRADFLADPTLTQPPAPPPATPATTAVSPSATATPH